MSDPSTSTSVLNEVRGGGDAAPRVLFLSAASGLAQDRSWVWDLQSRYDLVHWHGGLEELSRSCARQMVGALAEAGKPLVVTVDTGLLTDVATDAAQTQEILVRAAAAVIVADVATAEAIRDRWERDCVVIADPETDDESCDRIHRSVVAALS